MSASDVKSGLPEICRALRKFVREMHDVLDDEPAAQSLLAKLDDMDRQFGADDDSPAAVRKDKAHFEA